MFHPWVPKVIYTNKVSYINLVYLGLFLIGFLKKRKRALKHAVQRNTSNLRKWKFSAGTLPKNPTESKVCQPEFTKEFRWPTLYNAWKSHLDFVLQPGEIKDLYFFFWKKKKKEKVTRHLPGRPEAVGSSLGRCKDGAVVHSGVLQIWGWGRQAVLALDGEILEAILLVLLRWLDASRWLRR